MGVSTRLGPPALLAAGLLGAWQWVVAATDVPTVVLPGPLDVAGAAVDLWPTLLGDAATTALTAAGGLAGGIALGIALAVVASGSRTASAVVQPTVVGARVAPVVAIAPLLFLWFDRSVATRALLVTTMTTFPVTVATVEGLRSTPAEYLDLARSVGASRLRTALSIQVRAAAPDVFAGIKIAAAVSVVGAVVAEFAALRNGLGYRVFTTAGSLQTARTFAALTVLAVLGVAFFGAAALAERAVRWD